MAVQTKTEWEKKKEALDAIGVKSDILVENQKKKAETGGEVQYTMFVSGLRRGRNNELESKNQTDDLAIFFDSVTRHTYSKDYNKTSYSVESKSKAADHVVTQDGKFSFEAIITDSPQVVDPRNYLDRDTNKDNPLESKRPSKAVQIIQEIADAHQLVTLVTEDNILTNYVITGFTADRNSDTGSAITISISMEEFRFKNISKTVLARSKTADPKKAGKANSGTKQTAEGGAADDNAKAKRKTPYIGKNAAAKERIENAVAGTTDFSGEAGKKLPFDPNNLLKR